MESEYNVKRMARQNAPCRNEDAEGIRGWLVVAFTYLRVDDGSNVDHSAPEVSTTIYLIIELSVPKKYVSFSKIEE